MLTNHEDDAVARTVAENKVTDLLVGAGTIVPEGGAVSTDSARYVLGQLARTISFETAVSKVRGQEIALRRLVAVGEWEVDPSGGLADK
jgi:hypothetical protein